MSTLTQQAASDLFRREPDRHLDVGPGEVAYRRVGNGPDVLFVHGWPVSGSTFRAVLPHLAEHVTCHLIDLVGTGSSRFEADTRPSIGGHIESVRRVVDLLALDRFAAVGHDSGGMIARHALAGDRRLAAMGLINTEQPRGLSWRLKLFLAIRPLPALGPTLAWVAGTKRLRRNKFVFGDAFADASLLDGEFDEFALAPIRESPKHREAAVQLLRSFDQRFVRELGDLHRRLEVPVQLVWGDRDPFFPLAWAEEMVDTFPDAQLAVIEGAGLLAHEERPAEVASALLPVLTGERPSSSSSSSGRLGLPDPGGRR